MERTPSTLPSFEGRSRVDDDDDDDVGDERRNFIQLAPNIGAPCRTSLLRGGGGGGQRQRPESSVVMIEEKRNINT